MHFYNVFIFILMYKLFGFPSLQPQLFHFYIIYFLYSSACFSSISTILLRLFLDVRWFHSLLLFILFVFFIFHLYSPCQRSTFIQYYIFIPRHFIIYVELFYSRLVSPFIFLFLFWNSNIILLFFVFSHFFSISFYFSFTWLLFISFAFLFLLLLLT